MTTDSRPRTSWVRWCAAGVMACAVIAYLGLRSGPESSAGPSPSSGRIAARPPKESRSATSKADDRSPRPPTSFDKAGAEWDKIRSSGENAALFRLVADLSAQDLGKTLELILSRTEPGSLRNDLIASAFTFSSASSLREVFARATEQELPGERKAALSGIAQKIRLSTESLDEFFEILPGLHDDDLAAAASGLGQRHSAIHHREGDAVFTEVEGDLKRALESISSPGKETFLRNFSKSYQANDPEAAFAMWSILNETSKPFPEKTRSEIAYNIGRQMMAADPQRAMGTLLDAQVPATAASGAFGQWVSRNSDQAMSWYTSNQSSLSPDVRAGMATQIAFSELRQGNIDAARRWVDTLENPTLRSRTLSTLNSSWQAQSKWAAGQH